MLNEIKESGNPACRRWPTLPLVVGSGTPCPSPCFPHCLFTIQFLIILRIDGHSSFVFVVHFRFFFPFEMVVRWRHFLDAFQDPLILFGDFLHFHLLFRQRKFLLKVGMKFCHFVNFVVDRFCLHDRC